MATMSLPQPPILFDATPETILREVQDLIRVRTKLWDDIEKTVSPETVTVANFMRPILDNENEWIARHQVLCFYASTSPSKDIREASNEAADAFHGCEVDLYLRQDVYRLASSLLERHTSHPVDLGAETLRWLEQFQFRFIQNGCALESDLVRDSVREGLKQLEEYQRQFRKNLHDDESGIWLSDEELRGVPKDFFRRVELGKEENEGKFWVPMKIGLVTQVLKYAETETTRRRVSTLHQNRLNDKNIPLHRNMVLLRDRLARELGFSNHAAFRCQERMVNQPEKILSFLNEVRVPLVARGRKEVARLLNLKRADSQSSNTAPGTLFYWDHQYYDRLADEQETSLVLSDVSDYFELHQTLRGLMDIYEHLFAIRFQEIKLEEAEHTFGEKAAYFKPHEDCRVFGLWDESTDSFLGFMYFDFHPRPGKYNHAGHYLLQPGYTKPDGGRFYPSAAIVMNYPPPTESKPSVLSMDQVRSFFHEMGHGLHNVLSVTECARFHGTRVERDFVEAPSMMFEYFFWTPLHIKEVSHHYSHLSPNYEQTWRAENPQAQHLPPLQLPDDTVGKLLRLKHTNKPLSLLKNLHFSLYDMTVHTPASHEELSAMNFCEVFNQTRNDIMGLQGGEALGEGWEWAHFESLFRHINGGSYDVGYYAYVMGRIWALDIFHSTFKNNTRDREAGRRYRDMVLRPGGSQPAMVTFIEFMGREPSPEEFYKWMGISK